MQPKIILTVAYSNSSKIFWCPNITLQLKKLTIEMPTPIVDEKWKMKFSFQLNKNDVSLPEKKSFENVLVEYKDLKMVNRCIGFI